MNKKYRKRKVPKYFFIISLVLFLSIGVGYSVIYSNLSLQGNVTKKANTWNILFQNPVFDEGSIASPLPTITGGTNMTMNVNLTAPGQKYAFVVDLTNNGNVPALIKTLNITELTEEQAKYLRWKVEYEDESTPAVGDVLKAGETKKLHILLEYKNLRATDLYPKDNVNLNLSIAINYYLPEEAYNTVTLTKNGSAKTIQVSNLEQETILTDIPIESNDQVIACNNGVEPSTNNENQIVLNKVKQNATCRIESSLASAVTNSGTEVTNMAVLQDATTDKIATIEQTQNIKINLNGKNYTMIDATTEGPTIYVKGNLKAFDYNAVKGSLITTSKRLFEATPTSNTTINGGTYKRLNTDVYGTVIRAGGNVLIENASFISDNGATVASHYADGIVTIKKSKIENTTSNHAIFAPVGNNIINIIDSELKSNDTYVIYANQNNVSIYLCRNKIFNVTDHEFFIRNNPNIYYSKETLFTNNSTTPTFDTSGSVPMKSDIACAE